MLSCFSRVQLFCDAMDCSPPASSVHGILQAWILEWVAMPSSRGSSQPRDRTWDCCFAGRFFTVSHQGNLFETKHLLLVWRMDILKEVDICWTCPVCSEKAEQWCSSDWTPSVVPSGPPYGFSIWPSTRPWMTRSQLKNHFGMEAAPF